MMIASEGHGGEWGGPLGWLQGNTAASSGQLKEQNWGRERYVEAVEEVLQEVEELKFWAVRDQVRDVLNLGESSPNNPRIRFMIRTGTALFSYRVVGMGLGH
uniref:Uncharacterized protein n=1 Tax=Micrurus corallinus TaxID=54390 RepID=A0A2D4G7E8_MICCO